MFSATEELGVPIRDLVAAKVHTLPCHTRTGVYASLFWIRAVVCTLFQSLIAVR